MAEVASTWLILPVPLVPNKSQVMLMGAAPSDKPAKVIPPTLVAGLMRLPLELKSSEPVVLDDATGSWITLPDVVIPAPVIVNWPEAFAVTVVVAGKFAAVSADCSAVAYALIVSPAVTAGAAMVVETPPVFGPVIVRLVPGSTVAKVAPLEPKL